MPASPMSADVASDDFLFAPITRPPAHGPSALSASVRRLATMTLKVLVLGEQSCGKTSFVRAYFAAALRNAAVAGLPLSDTPAICAAATTPLASSSGASAAAAAAAAAVTSYEFSPPPPATVGVDFWPAPVAVPARLPTVRSAPGAPASAPNTRIVPVFYDVSGDLTYVKVRAEAYGDWHVALYCCDCGDRASFEQVQAWVAELEKVLSVLDMPYTTSNTYILSSACDNVCCPSLTHRASFVSNPQFYLLLLCMFL